MSNFLANYDGKGRLYAAARRPYDSSLLDATIKELGLSANSQLLDVGAGTGNLGLELVRRGYRNTIMLEPSSSMIEVATERLLELSQQSSVVGARIAQGSSTNSGLPDQSIDAILAGTAMHWFPVAESIAEFARILKPSGKVAILYTGTLESNRPVVNEYEELLLAHVPRYKEHKKLLFMQSGLRAVSECFIDNMVPIDGPIIDRNFIKEEFIQWALARSFMPADEDSRRNIGPILGQFFDKNSKQGVLTLSFSSGADVGLLKKLKVQPEIKDRVSTHDRSS